MTQQQSMALWMYSVSDLKKDATFFIPLGIIFGMIQFIGHRYFKQSNFGTELILEHIAFNSVMLISTLLIITKGINIWRVRKHKKEIFKMQIAHLSIRTIALISPAACIMAGVTLSALLVGSYAYAYFFLSCTLYLISILEIITNPTTMQEQSKTFLFALSFVGTLPFGLELADKLMIALYPQV